MPSIERTEINRNRAKGDAPQTHANEMPRTMEDQISSSAHAHLTKELGSAETRSPGSCRGLGGYGPLRKKLNSSRLWGKTHFPKKI